MPENISQIFNHLFHQLIDHMHIFRLDKWSDQLKNVTMLELRVFRMVKTHPDMLIGEIRDVLDIPYSTLTSVINRMEKRGFIRRVISLQDRRSFTLELTEAGNDVQREHERVDLMLAEKALEALDSDDEKEALVRLFTKITQRL